ncbi:sigma factor-like helix-turn-helix DNA-binding protein [Planctomycetota bacterium]|nr:sigma factor-like helix-turn-helix DNA-binding protein [Planctomycetota bacterium]
MDCTGCPKRTHCQRPCAKINEQLPSLLSKSSIPGSVYQFKLRQLPRLQLERNAMFEMLEHRHKLKGRQRQVFRLYYNQGLTTREIGRRLGVDQRSAAEYLKRARTALCRMALSQPSNNSKVRPKEETP